MMTEITLRLEKIGVIPVIAIEHINHALAMADALIEGLRLLRAQTGIAYVLGENAQ